jgi:RNA polymerase sigma factor (sigma-70 family)
VRDPPRPDAHPGGWTTHRPFPTLAGAMDRVPAAGPAFPPTRLSVLLAARSDDVEERRRAFGVLVASYWRPVYKYLRLRWHASPEDAEDLTQGFFARAFEKGFFDRFDPARARFRTFLRTCLDAHAGNARAAARRLKRGGAARTLSLDFAAAEGELRRQPAAPDTDMEEFFHREWVRSVFGLSVDALRRRCEARGRTAAFEVFRRYDLEEGEDRPTYAELGRALGLPVTQVTNHLAAMRREFRGLVLDALREQCATDAEFRAEARALLGVDAP